MPAHFKVFPSIPYKEALEAYEVVNLLAASSDTNCNTLDTMDYGAVV